MSKITITRAGGRRICFDVHPYHAELIHDLLASFPSVEDFDYFGDLSLNQCKEQAARFYRRSHSKLR